MKSIISVAVLTSILPGIPLAQTKPDLVGKPPAIKGIQNFESRQNGIKSISNDILGIKIGMTPDQAEAVISSSIQIEKKYKFGLKDKTINAAFVSGTILVSEKKDEYLILIHESRINNNKIVSVGRFSYKGNGQINESDLIASLVEKYGVGFKSNAEGKIYQSGGKRTVTGAGESACFVHMAGLSSAFEFTDDSGQPIDPSDMMHDDLRSVINNVSSLPWIGFDPSYLNDISKIKDCDINVAAWIPTNTGSLSGFMIWMSDLSGYAAELLRVINLPGANVDKGQKNFRL